MTNFGLDATVVVAIIGLFGAIYTTKMNTLTTMNKQLMELVEELNSELKELKIQHEAKTELLEKKISILTQENIELRNQVVEFKFMFAKSNK